MSNMQSISPTPLSGISNDQPTKKPKIPCHFFKQGNCSKGAACRFSHSFSPPKSSSSSLPFSTMNFDESFSINLDGLSLNEPISESPIVPEATQSFKYNEALVNASHFSSSVPVPASGSVVNVMLEKKKELCIFAMNGKCRFGMMCRSVHGIQCPRCLKFCLHPDDIEQNEEHIRQCLEAPSASCITTEEENRIECGICFELVLSKSDPRFGLLNCEHAFCITCIRTWRSKYSMDLDNLRSCPLCRTTTYFLVPSSVWVSDAEEKAALIDNYKRKLSQIPCRHYSQGASECPFGTSCFYSHANEDGTVEKPHLRTVVGENEKMNVYRETKLSDFLVFKQQSGTQ